MAALAIPKNMKVYAVGLLYPGPKYEALSDKAVPANLELQAAHLNHVRSGLERQTLVMAVPILTEGSRLSAMSVFAESTTAEEATKFLADDPAIKAGRFTYEVLSAFFPSLDGVKVEY